jgi:hypothetical protein
MFSPLENPKRRFEEIVVSVGPSNCRNEHQHSQHVHSVVSSGHSGCSRASGLDIVLIAWCLGGPANGSHVNISRLIGREDNIHKREELLGEGSSAGIRGFKSSK